MTERKLSPKQKRFVEEYLVDLNATQAAIRAGYSKKTAYSIGEENLKKPDVKAAVDKAKEKRSKETKIDQEYVIKVITETIERCAQAHPVVDLFGRSVLVEIPDGTKAAAYRFKEMAVLKGAELLMKHLGMGVDNHNHTVNVQAAQSGVLVAPAPMTADAWEKAAMKQVEAASD